MRKSICQSFELKKLARETLFLPKGVLWYLVTLLKLVVSIRGTDLPISSL